MHLPLGFVTLFGGDGEEEWGGRRHPRKSGVAKEGRIIKEGAECADRGLTIAGRGRGYL